MFVELVIWNHQYSGCSSVLFLSGSSSIECLPETKEAGGSYPGVGGSLARVLSVHGESWGVAIDKSKALDNYHSVFRQGSYTVMDVIYTSLLNICQFDKVIDSLIWILVYQLTRPLKHLCQRNVTKERIFYSLTIFIVYDLQPYSQEQTAGDLIKTSVRSATYGKIN